ncbi:tetratricopeptide repeat protein [uncultured Dokdonia sp.]|uniref:tetratricopeptide repeat protein n=1 Tax=uncultured Dokdonia sp. TaxID=575653 RepID=UPI0026206A34|nr:tetratricopeptide repeat protein [uncultured Dokdonia sp.]
MLKIITWLCCFFVLSSSAQEATYDSLQHVLKKNKTPSDLASAHYAISATFSSEEIDSSLFHLKKAYQIAAYNTLDSIHLLSSVSLAKKYYHEVSNKDSTLYYMSIGHKINERLQVKSSMYSLNALNAYVLEGEGKFAEAIGFHLRNIPIADNLKDAKKKAYAFSGIADVYRLQGNGKKAVEYMEFASKAATLLDDSYLNTKVGMSLNLALAYDVNDQRKESVALLEATIPMAIKDKPFSEALIYHNLGRSYIINGKYEAAETYLNKALNIDAWATVPRRKLASLKELTTLYTAINRFDEAVIFGEQTYDLACQLEIQYHLEDATRNLAEAYELSGDFENSVRLKNEYIAIINNIFDQDKNSLMLELDAKYQTSKKEQAIQQLLSESIIRKRNTVIWSLLGLFVILFLFYNRFYNRKKNTFLLKQKELEIKAEKDRNDLIALRLKNEKIFSRQQQQEKEIIALELKLKEKELTTNAMSLLQHKKHYESLIEKLKDIRLSSDDIDASSKIASVINETKASLVSYNWEEFQYVFEKVHVDFYHNLLKRFPNITPNEKKISAFLRLGLSTKDISAITNQTPHSILIARSRLRKKLGLSKEQSLTKYINSF